jgi:hypothetical protein
MKGETTVDQRIEERLRKLEEVRKFYAQWYRLENPEWATDLIAALTEHAAWLALYEGVDYDTLAAEVVKEVRNNFPDIV